MNPQILAQKESEYNQAWATAVEHFERDLDANNHELVIAILTLNKMDMHRAAMFLACVGMKLNLEAVQNEYERSTN